MAILDSTFLCDYIARRKGAVALMEKLEKDASPLRVPAAVWIEVLHVISPRKRSETALELERNVTFVNVDRELADEAARLQHELRAEGAPLGWHDLQIAATAMRYQEPVISNDHAFDGVPGLVRIGH